MQILLSNIKSLEPKNAHVTLPFNVVSLARKWKAVKDSGYSKAFLQMKEFFAAVESAEAQEFDDMLFSKFLQNVWAKSIDEVMGALGIVDFALTVSQQALVDELVDKRNAIAHGRDSAASIGERYRCDELRKRLVETQALTFDFIARLEAYFDDREFIRVGDKDIYGILTV